MTNDGGKNMVANNNRERRVAALEAADYRDEPVVIPLICAELDETSEAAVARYTAESGPLPVVREGRVNAIVLMPVAPAARAAA